MNPKFSPGGFVLAYAVAVPLALGVAANWHLELSLPPLDGNTAAWVQAIGSILALLVAVFMGQHQATAARKLYEQQFKATRQRDFERQEALQRLLVGYAEQGLAEIDRAETISLNTFASPENFDTLRASLAAFPAHDLPDATSALAVNQIHAALTRYHSRHRTLRREAQAGAGSMRLQQLRGRMQRDRNDIVKAISEVEHGIQTTRDDIIRLSE